MSDSARHRYKFATFHNVLHLAPDRKKSFYEMTDKGRQYLANPPEEVESEELEGTTQEKHVREAQRV